MRILLTTALAASAALFASAPSHASVVQAEYFVGTDPGAGLGTAIPLTVAADSTAIDLPNVILPAGKPAGTYTVGVRVKDSAGRWSNPLLRRYTIYAANFGVHSPSDPSGALAKHLIAAEYFVGADPGAGLGNALAITENGFTAESATINPLAAGQVPGTYQVGLRFKDSTGHWGNPIFRRTTISSASLVSDTVASLPTDGGIPVEAPTAQSYFIGLNGGFRCGDTFRISIGGEQLELPARPFETAEAFMSRLALAINSDPHLSSLAGAVVYDGSSRVLVTATQNGWQPSNWVTVSTNLNAGLRSTGSIGSEARKIVAAEYFVGLPPMPGTGAPITVDTNAANTCSFDTATVPITMFRGGSHPVGVRFKNAAGQWGQPIIRGFTSYVLFGDTDSTAPQIQLNGPAILELPYGAGFTDPGWTATDNIDGNLTSGVVVTGTVKTQIPGSYVLTYQVSDLAGNLGKATRTVKVVDVEAPAIEGAQTLVYNTPPATTDLFAGLRAVDGQFGDLSYRLKLISSTVDWFTPGSYSAVFQVADPMGNTTTLTRTITLGEQGVFYPGFASWITERGASVGATRVQMDPDADPDFDGRKNSAEWMADTDPFNRWSNLAMTYSRSATTEDMQWSAQKRIAYRLETSVNLVSWQQSGDPILLNESCTLKLEVPRNDQLKRQFFRINAAPRQPILEVPPQP